MSLPTSQARTHEKKWGEAAADSPRSTPAKCCCRARRDRGIEERAAASRPYAEQLRSSKNCDYSLSDVLRRINLAIASGRGLGESGEGRLGGHEVPILVELERHIPLTLCGVLQAAGAPIGDAGVDVPVDRLLGSLKIVQCDKGVVKWAASPWLVLTERA